MIIPGFLVTWVTFPGVVVHELGHELFCRLTGTRVRSVCYFRFGNPAGYVIHDQPQSIWKHIPIGFGPLVTNTAVGFLLGLIATRHVLNSSGLDLIGFILTWLAVSVAMHSFPSTGDARSLWYSLWGRKCPLLARLVGTPLVGMIYLGALGSVFWLDLVYGLVVAVVLPRAILV